MNIPADLKYTKEHEWLKVEGQLATMGITDYAQGELGDIVFTELPKVGTRLEQMKPFGVIEAVKAVSEIFSPITGEVTEVNSKLESEPTTMNSDPYGAGWIIKIKVANHKELNNLLSAEEYKKLLEEH
ncbi:MAG TPA: glycine cleavage system protein GcvH [candidate division Zixibacteria bacterium]